MKITKKKKIKIEPKDSNIPTTNQFVGLRRKVLKKTIIETKPLSKFIPKIS